MLCVRVVLTASFFEQRVRKCAKRGIQPFQIYRIYVFFFIIIIIFTFSPPSTLVGRSARDGEISSSRQYYTPPATACGTSSGPNSHRRRRCVMSRFSFRPKLDYYIIIYFFRFRFDTVWICRDFEIFFFYLLHLSKSE